MYSIHQMCVSRFLSSAWACCTGTLEDVTCKKELWPWQSRPEFKSGLCAQECFSQRLVLCNRHNHSPCVYFVKNCLALRGIKVHANGSPCFWSIIKNWYVPPLFGKVQRNLTAHLGLSANEESTFPEGEDSSLPFAGCVSSMKRTPREPCCGSPNTCTCAGATVTSYGVPWLRNGTSTIFFLGCCAYSQLGCEEKFSTL